MSAIGNGDEFVDSVIEAVVAVGTVVGDMTDGQTIAGPISPWDVPAGGVIVTAVICLLATGLLLVACVIIGLALVARNMLLYIRDCRRAVVPVGSGVGADSKVGLDLGLAGWSPWSSRSWRSWS